MERLRIAAASHVDRGNGQFGDISSGHLTKNLLSLKTRSKSHGKEWAQDI
jgi:hypothetical protein